MKVFSYSKITNKNKNLFVSLQYNSLSTKHVHHKKKVAIILAGSGVMDGR